MPLKRLEKFNILKSVQDGYRFRCADSHLYFVCNKQFWKVKEHYYYSVYMIVCSSVGDSIL